ncbi:nitrite reductase small subunit NirD [Marinihelvus fidelis]|uniref:Nitrite reductase small subunit NirD n=1 Tax=Marinihelvus fidelis TaxID=2613842 RepID=A0A5N0T420_9GAMM|nr:nitrite reductase small subunit NirD [Marinihelvus fidelis]KAA9129815.1 nitrite reductase small subunit NirD [Marinihelvus fidelis]
MSSEAVSRAVVADGVEWHEVCAVDDILAGTGVAALLGETQVALFRLRDDRVYAIGNHDPFSHAPVLSRGIVGDLGGRVVVASPLFKQHFRLEDGGCVEDEAVNVGSFPVDVVDGRVRVGVAAG